MRKFAKMSTTEEKINGVEIVDCDDESKSDEEFEKQAETDAATENEQNGGNAIDAEKEEETEATENGEGEEPKKSKRGRKPKGATTPKAKKTPTKSKPKKKVKLAVSDEEEEEEEEYEVSSCWRPKMFIFDVYYFTRDSQVQDIIDHRTEGKKVFYQIRWKGYGPSGDTWEAEGSLACPDIIKRYKAKVSKNELISQNFQVIFRNGAISAILFFVGCLCRHRYKKYP
jgi:Chromo (CHRromatin Organisation MOdifier) domain